jgi:hypothetical protein
MILLAAIFAVLAAAFAAQAAMLTDRLRVARLELAVLKRRLAPPPPPAPAPAIAPRQFECRRERAGLLWFPVLTAKDGEKSVVGVSSGLPHCVRCVLPLKLVSGRTEAWVCSGCGESHPGKSADLLETDLVLTDCLREFFARHPDYSPAPGLSAPKFEPAAAA